MKLTVAPYLLDGENLVAVGAVPDGVLWRNGSRSGGATDAPHKVVNTALLLLVHLRRRALVIHCGPHCSVQRVATRLLSIAVDRGGRRVERDTSIEKADVHGRMSMIRRGFSKDSTAIGISAVMVPVTTALRFSYQ